VNEPLVSAVIPVYNGAKSINRTLESVRAQTHCNLEILVVDDGSVDDTPAIVRSHCIADRRVGLLHQANGGVARARNTGLRHARGEFVAFIDADDLWHPTRVAKHVIVMRAGGDKVAVVYSPCRWIDEHDNVIGSSCAYGCSGSVLLRLIYSNFVGNGSALLLRRSAALEAGGFDPGLRDNGIEGCEDYLLQLKLAQRYEFGLMPEYLVGYRVYSPRMSSDGARMQASKQHVLESIRRARPDLPDAPFELLKLKSTPARPATFKPVAPIARKYSAFSTLLCHGRLTEKIANLWQAKFGSSTARGRSARRRPFLHYHPAEASSRGTRYDELAMRYLEDLEAALGCGPQRLLENLPRSAVG